MVISCSPSYKAMGQTQDHPSLEQKKHLTLVYLFGSTL